MRSEAVEIKPVSICVECGKDRRQVKLNRDHFYPQCMIGPYKSRASSDNPFRLVVYHSYNVFPMCEVEHQALDREKTSAFLHQSEDKGNGFSCRGVNDPNRGDPVALIRFLIVHYPLSSNPTQLELQVRRMMFINNLFINTALNLNGELSLDLRARYRQAAELTAEYNQKLQSALIVSLNYY